MSKHANLSQSISSIHDWKLNKAFLIYTILVTRNVLIVWWYIDVWYQMIYYETKLYDISRLYLAYSFFFPYFFLSIKFIGYSWIKVIKYSRSHEIKVGRHFWVYYLKPKSILSIQYQVLGLRKMNEHKDINGAILVW